MHKSVYVHAWMCMRKRDARDCRKERGRERKRDRERGGGEREYAPWGMMAKLLRAVSQLGWLARRVSVRFVRRLTAWSRRDKARPTLPLGFCSGLISYPPALPGHPRRYAVRGVFRDSHPYTGYAYGVRLTTWSSSPRRMSRDRGAS